MEKLNLQQIQQEELNMLKDIIEFLKKHNIKYYICGGTAIGAIRHKGFIPWDDDIDIMMPRPDFEKFQKFVKDNEKKLNDYLEVISYDLGNMSFPLCKVEKKNLILDEVCVQEDNQKYLWIDVFPIDGFPESEEESKKFYKKVLRMRKLVIISCSNKKHLIHYCKRKIYIIPKLIMRFFLKNIKEKIAEKYSNFVKKYNYENSKYVGAVVWGYGPQERLLKEKIKDFKASFEWLEVNLMECYDEYLTNLYGDYMQLPPIEKRFNHQLIVYKIGDEEKDEKDLNRVCNK